jgi:hypothetical protein
MLASWSTDGALIFTETKETFTLTGAESYTIATGGAFNTTSPNDIIAAYVTRTGTDTHLQVIDATEYAKIADKDGTGTPLKIYYDQNYPTPKIYIYPVNQEATTITLISEKALTGFSSLDTVFAMPAEYERALIHNLAIEMASEFGKEPTMTVKRIAKESLDNVKRQNKKNNKGIVVYDGIVRGGYDIYSGQYV